MLIESVNTPKRRDIRKDRPPILKLFRRSLEATGVSAQSVRAHFADARGLVRFLCRTNHIEESAVLTQLSQADIESYIRHLLRADSKYDTVKRHMVTLRKLCNFLVREHYLTANPVDGRSVGSAHEDFLPTQALMRVLEYCNRHEEDEATKVRYYRDELVFLFQLLYGIRQYHIPRLEISSIKSNEKGIAMEVSGLGDVSLDHPVVQLISTYLAERNSSAHTLFIEGESGLPLSPGSMKKFWNEISREIGKNFNPNVVHQTHLRLLTAPADLQKVLESLQKQTREL